MMRVHYQEKLDDIRHDIILMANAVNEMVGLAVSAALNGDPDAAARVMAMDDQVDELDRSLLSRTVLAVMQEAPVANDIKFLVSVLGVIGEIEKAGDDAVKLARRVRKLQGQFPGEMKLALSELATLTRRSFAGSLRLFCDYSEVLASEIVIAEEQIDLAYKSARDRILELIRQNPGATEDLVRTIEIFHALEHVADHAVAIAVRMSMVHGERGADS